MRFDPFTHDPVSAPASYVAPDADPNAPVPPEPEPPTSTTWTYNDDHQFLTATRPDGQQVAMTYEASGRLDFLTTSAGAYDATYRPTDGRLSSLSAPSGVLVAYDYAGPWTTAITTTGPAPGTIQFELDRPVPGQTKTNLWLGAWTLNDDDTTRVGFTYDDDGLVTRVTRGEGAGGGGFGGGGSTAGPPLDLYREEATGRVFGTSLDQFADRATYSSFGELATSHSTVRATGDTCVVGGPAPVLQCTTILHEEILERDRFGRIVERRETSRATPAAPETVFLDRYLYDDHAGQNGLPGDGRLIGVERNGQPLATYGYDPNGNRTSWSDPWGTTTATYDQQDRLLAKSEVPAGGGATRNTTYTYTLNGDLATKVVSDGATTETTTYTYDVLGQLLTVSLPTGVTIDYVIDGRQRRVGKKVNGTLVTGWLYSSGLSPLAELEANGSLRSQFVYATHPTVPDFMVRGGVTYRFVRDHLGSVRAVVDVATGAFAQRLDYDVWGRVILDTNPGFQPFGFAGGLYEPATGLVRFGARDYDPETGRWTAKDPIGFAGGATGLYGYVGGDPVNRVDPTGLQPDRYTGLMREFAEHPTLASANTLGAGMATGVTLLMAAPAAFYGCASVPGACQLLVADLVNPNPGDVIPPVGAAAIGLMDAGERFLRFASRRADVDPGGVLDVVVHGTANSVEVGGRTVDHRVLAAIIERHPEFNGQNVRLLSCSTGACPDGVAQNLSNRLGVTVLAPNDILWAHPDGMLTIGPDPVTNSGQWLTFTPGN